jgi:glycosyltransferase involved in cell wall biosynthesis
VKLSIVIPCLNEVETLAIVIMKANQSISDLKITGEVIVADNGSSDGSQEIVRSLGARLVQVPRRGYGAALIAGINAARGQFVIMGDADDSYALDNLQPFLGKLNEGFDLVMGNRFAGGIAEGAMPWLHKYIGNPVLSYIGRLFFKVPIGDFHCGLRGFRRASILSLDLNSSGMEFASEMVVKASLNHLKICEVPTTLQKDGRTRPPHLRTWRDGWRHLVFLLAASPRWLFLYPGLILTFFGTLGMLSTVAGAVNIAGVQLDSNTYFLSLGVLLVGIQTTLMAILARVFSSHHGILPKSISISRFEKYFTLERGVVFGVSLILLSVVGLGVLVFNWTGSGFRGLNTSSSLRMSGLFVLTLTSGIQILFASFFASMLQV